MSNALLKNELRQQINSRLKNLTRAQREEASAKARALLQRQMAWQNANTILFYAPLAGELDISPLLSQSLQEGRTVLLPKFDSEIGCYAVCRIQNVEEDLLPGKFGVREPRGGCQPFPLNQLDLILVPGVGFAAGGGRLGRGGGYYDRLLAQVSGIKCGVAFDEQIEPHVPVEPHDIRLNCILTPTRWLVAG